MNETVTPGAMRKRLYDYLQSEGFELTPARHKIVSQLVKLSANATCGQYQREIEKISDRLVKREIALGARTVSCKPILCHTAGQHHDLRCYFDCKV